MAKNKGSSTSARLPDIGFDVRATFLDVREPKNKASRQAKGVLEVLKIRRPNPNNDANGDVKLRFLSSYTHATHSNILYAAGYSSGEQPIIDVPWGMPFHVAARYTARPEKRGPLEMSLMIGGINGCAEAQRGYTDVRRTVALACGVAVLRHEYRRDPAQVEIKLDVINDFTTPGEVQAVPFSASNIADLAQKLS